MNIGVIFAGGIGSRMGNIEIPKQFLKVNDVPIIIHTLRIFEKHEDIDAIVISVLEEYIQYTRDLIDEFKITKVVDIVSGGSTGQLSIYNGLIAAKKFSDNIVIDDEANVLIHDGVRPNIDKELITNNLLTLSEYGTSITSSPATETFLVTDNIKKVGATVKRDNSYVAKAPQCFVLNDILDVHEMALSKGIDNSIDSCTLYTDSGRSVSLTIGPLDNFKITSISDYEMYKGIMEEQHE